MKFTVSRDQLLEALLRIQSSVEKRNTVPVLGSVLCSVRGNELRLYATDLEVGMKSVLQVEEAAEGAVAIVAKTFTDIVRELPSGKNIRISKKANEWIEMECDDYHFDLLGIPAHEFPPAHTLPSFDGRPYFEAKASDLSEMIDKTIFALSTDTALYHLNGVYLEPVSGSLMRMTASDMYRLSSIEREIFLNAPQVPAGMIIPKKGLIELRKLLNDADSTIGLSFERGILFAHSKNTYLFVRLIEGDYIDYRRIVPNGLDQKAVLDRESLLGALKRVSLVTSEKTRRVKIVLGTGSMTVFCSNPEMGEARAKIEADYPGEEVEIGFNSKYLIEYLQAVHAEKIELCFRGKLSPALLQEVGQKSHSYVLMPMRVI